MQQRSTVLAEPRSAAHTPMVVVAEDDEDLLNELCVVLRREGFAVVPISDGEALIGFMGTCELHGRAPDVIISDHFMPGYSGLDIMQALSEHGWATPVIIISGYGDRELVAAAQAHGARGYFRKPLDVPRLCSAIYECIDWSSRRLSGAATSRGL